MPGYAIVPDIEAPELTAMDFVVWRALCRHNQWEKDENGMPVKSVEGSCFPSLQAIMDKARCARSTVCESLKKLEALGYIIRKQHQKGKVYTSTEYILFAEEYRYGVVRQPNRGCPTREQGLSDTRTTVVRNADGGSPRGGLEVVRQPDPNITSITRPDTITREQDNTPLPPSGETASARASKPSRRKAQIKHPVSKSPLKGVAYDIQAFKVITEMYGLCEDYVPDAPSEIRLVQDLGQEYPGVPLFAQFRKASDWLENHPKKCPKNLRRFLRNWIANAVNRYGETGQRLVGYENIVTFTPIPEGGTANAGVQTNIA